MPNAGGGKAGPLGREKRRGRPTVAGRCWQFGLAICPMRRRALALARREIRASLWEVARAAKRKQTPQEFPPPAPWGPGKSQWFRARGSGRPEQWQLLLPSNGQPGSFLKGRFFRFLAGKDQAALRISPLVQKKKVPRCLLAPANQPVTRTAPFHQVV